MKIKQTELITIESFEELLKIQDEEYRATCALDLLFLRSGEKIIDGIILLIQPDCITHAKIYFIDWKTYAKLTQGEKEYLERHYNIDLK